MIRLLSSLRSGSVRQRVSLGAAAALAAICLSPGSAQAYVVTVEGVQYDVTTFTGSYDDNTSKFETAANRGVMPWWGDYALTVQFATAVGTNLGASNSYGGNTSGPAFSYQTVTAGYTFGAAWCTASCMSGVGIDNSNWVFGDSVVYAQATLYTAPAPAPGPLPLFGAAAAFGYSRQLRKRIKPAPAALGSSQPLA